jgi:hypothetical protein
LIPKVEDRLLRGILVSRVWFLLLMLLASAGCASLRPAGRQPGRAADLLTYKWRQEILNRAQDGDWLVIQGYDSTNRLVALAGNGEFSHVGVLDATYGEVIEAVSPEVTIVPLQDFLKAADRVQLIRPIDADRAAGRRTLARARSQIGAPYDLLGTVGMPDPGEFYCSELAAWSAGIDVDADGVDKVLHPADMSKYGNVLFDSVLPADCCRPGVSH